MSDDDFGIESLAAYLHIDPAQVARLAERGKLPGRRVAGQWRFSQAEIHHWLEDRMGVSSEGELEHMEGALDRIANRAGDSEISIAELMPLEAIAVPLDARTRGSVITSMVELAAQTGWLWDTTKMAEAVRAREELMPTAQENGIALLHPRRPLSGILAQPLIALGCTASGIPFGAPRGALTDLFFLILSTDDRGHLRALARLSRLLTHANTITDLRKSQSAKEAREILLSREAEIS